MSTSERIDRLFSHLAQPGMPGAAVAVLHNGEVVCREGYGLADMQAGLEMTPETPYPIASMTKQFTTTCILLLEQEGRLSLDDDYRTYLPEIPDFGAPITIDHLCTNTSGIRDIFALVTLSGGRPLDPRPRSLVEAMMARQRTLNFPTGSQYRYSNPNFQILSWIIERLTGQRLGEFMAERIFEPLGMRHTSLQGVDQPPRRGGARCYDGDNREKLRPSEWEAFSRSGSGEGGGAIWSTLDDLILWERNFDHDVIGGAGLLDRLASAPRIPGSGEAFYARGLFVGTHRGLAWQGHGGAFGPGGSNRLRFPEAGLSVIILSNSYLMNPHLGAFEVADVILDQLSDVEPAPTFGAVAGEAIEPWLGYYEDPGSGLSFGLAEESGEAKLVLFGAPTKLEAIDPNLFVANRGYSLPTWVRIGPIQPDPEITVQMGPNPPMHMVRSAAPNCPVTDFRGSYCSAELDATHTVEVLSDALTVTVESPLGRRGNVPLRRVSENGFIAAYDDVRRVLYRFHRDPGSPPAEAVVSVAGAEQVRLRRVGP